MKMRFLSSKLVAQERFEKVFGYVDSWQQGSSYAQWDIHCAHFTYVKYAQWPVNAQQSCKVHLTWHRWLANHSNNISMLT